MSGITWTLFFSYLSLGSCIVLKDQPKDGAESVTVFKGSNGKPQCHPSSQCHGDPSDMVHAFYRYSRLLENKKMYDGAKISNFTVPASTKFWNAKDTQSCLKNKYVLMLGDSTLLENLNDIIMQLSGGPSRVSISKLHADFASMPKHSVRRYKTEHGFMKKDNRMNRNQTIWLEDQNTLIRFRFVGAQKLEDNCEGLQAMFKDELHKEIDLLVENEGRKPDAIVMQSASHDMCNNLWAKNHIGSFFNSLPKVGNDFVSPWAKSGINVIWRGNYRFMGEDQNNMDPKVKNDMRYPKKMDDEAKKTMEENGGQFLDVASVLAGYSDETGCCKTISSATTTFPHLGSVSVRQFHKATAFFSQLASYRILDAICPK